MIVAASSHARSPNLEDDNATSGSFSWAVGRAIKVLAFVLVVAFAIESARRIKRNPGRFRGAMYRLAGRRPDENVDDHTLADRVRSQLGPLEKQLDLPHVHVMVEDHVAILHGDVEWPHEAASVVHATRQVSGIRGVESHLHIGMLASDVRPSAGRLHAARRNH